MINQATLSVYILIFLFHQLIFVLQSITHSLLSARVGTPSTGTVQIKLGFVPTSDAQNLLEFDEIYTELIKCSQPLLVSALAVSFRFCLFFSISKCTAPCQTEGIGTVRSNKQQAYDDDGGLSSDAGNSDDEGEFTDAQEDNSQHSVVLMQHFLEFKSNSCCSTTLNCSPLLSHSVASFVATFTKPTLP